MDDPKTLVSTDWLAAHLSDPDLRIIDASWHMPATGRDARAEYDAGHIPAARFFDIDAISEYRDGEILLTLTDAERTLDAANRKRAQEELIALALALCQRVDLPHATRYRLVGVGISGFREREEVVQAGLFDPQEA